MTAVATAGSLEVATPQNKHSPVLGRSVRKEKIDGKPVSPLTETLDSPYKVYMFSLCFEKAHYMWEGPH